MDNFFLAHEIVSSILDEIEDGNFDRDDLALIVKGFLDEMAD